MPDLDLQHLTGKIAIVAPHMDDEALACGGLIAKLPHKDYVHIIYATEFRLIWEKRGCRNRSKQ
jgi:hypothetical protein